MTNAHSSVPKRFLVAGGFGFIGHRVTRQLLERGHDVHVLDQCKAYEHGTETEAEYGARLRGRRESIGEATVHIADICHASETTAIVEAVNPDVIIHLASVPVAGIASRAPSWAASQMLTGTANLLEAARSVGTNRFVYVSSSMVYGDFEVDPAPESHPKNCRDIYGTLKLAAERLTQAYQRLHGLECVTVRPMAVYGPTGNKDFVITKFLRAAMDGRPLVVRGSGTRLDLTFVEDAARGIALAGDIPIDREAVFNISSGRPRRLIDAARMISNMIGHVDLEIEPPSRHYPTRGGLDIEQARSQLSFEPRYSLEAGLEETIDAYR